MCSEPLRITGSAEHFWKTYYVSDTALGGLLHYIFISHILCSGYYCFQTGKLKPRNMNLSRSQGESVIGLSLHSGLQVYKGHVCPRQEEKRWCEPHSELKAVQGSLLGKSEQSSGLRSAQPRPLQKNGDKECTKPKKVASS